jgi:hypothetical protein
MAESDIQSTNANSVTPIRFTEITSFEGRSLILALFA